MHVTEAIRTGIRAAWRAKWMAVLFLACQLVMAAAVAAPMYTAIADHVGKSAAGIELARGFSLPWLTEFQLAYAPFLRGFSIAMVYAGVLFMLLHTALSAGAFEVFTRGEGAGLHAFGRGVGKYFLRFLRLMVIGSLLYYVCFWLLQDLAGKGLRWIFERHGVRQAPDFYLDWARWGLLALCVFVVSMILEYAKADMVRDDHEYALGALGHAAGFVFSRPGSTLGIFLGIGVLGALAIGTYSVFARYFPQNSVITVFLWFMVAQALMWLRWLFRLASWAAEVGFYAAHARRDGEAPDALPELPS